MLDGESTCIDLDARNIGRARHKVIGKRAGQRLSVRVVDQFGEDCAADAVGNRTDNLPVHDHAIESASGIVSHNVFFDPKEAGCGIEPDFCDMHGKAAGQDLLCLIDVTRFQRGFALEQRAAWRDCAGDLADCQVARTAVAIFDFPFSISSSRRRTAREWRRAQSLLRAGAALR